MREDSHEFVVQGLLSELKEKNELITKLKDALSWCGGSADFSPEGQAGEGWKKIVLPLIS